MVSVNTYSAAAATISRVMRQTDVEIRKTQERIVTGSKVNSSSDNPTVWNAVVSMKSDISTSKSIKDTLGKTAAIASIASAGIETAQSIVTQIKNVLVLAQAPAADKTSLQTDLKALQDQLKSVVSSADFGGTNWLNGSVTSVDATMSYSASSGLATSTTSIASLNLNDGAGGLGILNKNGTNFTTGSLLTIDISAATNANIAKMALDTEAAIKSLETASNTVSGMANRYAGQQNFLSKIIDIKEGVIADLTAIDPAEEAAKLEALNTQQQIAAQVLSSIAASNQNVLLLFRNL
jgi:flagellin